MLLTGHCPLVQHLFRGSAASSASRPLTLHVASRFARAACAGRRPGHLRHIGHDSSNAKSGPLTIDLRLQPSIFPTSSEHLQLYQTVLRRGALQGQRPAVAFVLIKPPTYPLLLRVAIFVFDFLSKKALSSPCALRTPGKRLSALQLAACQCLQNVVPRRE